MFRRVNRSSASVLQPGQSQNEGAGLPPLRPKQNLALDFSDDSRPVYDAQLDIKKCVYQGDRTHWCKFASFLTIACHKNEGALKNLGLDTREALNGSANLKFVSELYKIKMNTSTQPSEHTGAWRRPPFPKVNPQKLPSRHPRYDVPFATDDHKFTNAKFQQVQVDRINRELKLNCDMEKIGIKEQMSPVSYAELFGKCAGCYIILGFKKINHYCVLSQVTIIKGEISVWVFDPWAGIVKLLVTKLKFGNVRLSVESAGKSSYLSKFYKIKKS